MEKWILLEVIEFKYAIFLRLLRCPKKGCRSSISVRTGSEFFSFEKNKNKLSLYQILKLLEYYLMSTPLSFSVFFISFIPFFFFVQQLELNRNTVYDWRSLFRDPPFILFDRADQMGGSGEICQIDEILLRGKRKNNKGRIIKED